MEYLLNWVSKAMENGSVGRNSILACMKLISTKCLLESSYSSKQENFTINGQKLKVKNFKWPNGLNTDSLPSEVDLRTEGAVTDVKDQVQIK